MPKIKVKGQTVQKDSAHSQTYGLWRMETAVWRRIKKQLVCQPASLSVY